MVSVLIHEMEEYAKLNNIPIMINDSIEYISNIIKNNDFSKLLEIGTAIGYSTIRFRIVKDDIDITSIERDNERYSIACKNIEKSSLSNIKLINADALEIDINEKYDLIIIDAAKSQNIKFFNKYKNNLKKNGIIIIDNMNFHGLVGNSDSIESKNLKSMIKKLEMFWDYIDTQDEYDVMHLDIGDGLAICKKKNI